MVNLRIAFCGTSSTGKTTLSKLVAERLQLPWIDEGLKNIRGEQSLAMPKFEEADLIQKIYWQKEVNRRRISIERQHCSFVGDGSAVDMLAWTKFWCGATFDFNSMEELVVQLRNHIGCIYTHIFYLPFGKVPIEDDKRRIINFYTLEHVDALIAAECERIRRLGMAVHRVKATTPRERMDEVIRILFGCEKKRV